MEKKKKIDPLFDGHQEINISELNIEEKFEYILLHIELIYNLRQGKLIENKNLKEIKTR
ncbi:MAG TPA: hypothetical protein VHP32_03940 [Ignavibacteria bacterium]|nr:hypothetical protein [Ignavibacteria bacterium]